MQFVPRPRTFITLALVLVSALFSAVSAAAYNFPNSPGPRDGEVYAEPNQTDVYFLVQYARGKYDLYWGTDPTPPVVATGVPIAGTSNHYPVGLQAYGTTYHWRVVVHDVDGSEASGPTWSYRTRAVNEPPYIPIMEAPANGAIKLPINVTLDYSLYDLEGLVANADVYLGTDQNPPLVGDHVSPDKFTALLEPNKAYYWRVVARDAGGLTTSGPTWTFSTANTTNQSPTPPSLYWVSDPSSLTPFLYWGDASDPEKEPLTFDVYLSLVSNYQATNYQLIGSTTGHSMQVGPLQLHRRYYWRVKVKDSVWSVNGQEQWFDVGGYATPVLFSRFNAEPSGTNVEIHWTLQSDETMDSYTLFRHEGATGPALAIANAPVEGIEGSYVDKSVAPGKTYRYELMIRTTDGDEFRSPLVSVTTTAPGITLYQNVPNPFNPVTTIRYDLPASARVQVSIVDVSGRRVRSLTDELQAPGSHNAIWNGRDDTGSAVASGVYFSVLQAGKQRFTKKLVLLK